MLRIPPLAKIDEAETQPLGCRVKSLWLCEFHNSRDSPNGGSVFERTCSRLGIAEEEMRSISRHRRLAGLVVGDSQIQNQGAEGDADNGQHAYCAVRELEEEIEQIRIFAWKRQHQYSAEEAESPYNGH